MADQKMVYLAADKGRITAAMDKWEDHGGSRVTYETSTC